MSRIEELLESCIEYYKTEDFQNQYLECLCSDIEYGGEISLTQWIKDYNDRARRYEDEGEEIEIGEYDIENILTYIYNNIEEYSEYFWGYHVGDGCIASVSFGEQEEQFDGETFDSENDDDYGFYVSEDGVFYYDLSSEGLCVKVNEQVIRDILKKVAEDE